MPSPYVQERSTENYRDAFQVKLTRSAILRPVPEPESDELWAQNCASDYMVTCQWTVEGGWEVPEIKPFDNFSISPLASCLHYATQCFEGMKAFRGLDGNVRLFRPYRNAKRLAMSAKCVSLPQFDADYLVWLIEKLLQMDIDSSQCPPGASPRSSMRLITSQVDKIRAWPGGFGYAKVGANYGPSFSLHHEAQAANYDQVLWLFGPEGRVTEVGARNFFAIVRNRESGLLELLTALTEDKLILEGVTRNSVIQLVRSRLADELEVIESYFTIQYLKTALEEGRLLEAFVSGTAFFIKPVSVIRCDNEDFNLPQKENSTIKNFTSLIKTWLYDIMFGKEEYSWSRIVERDLGDFKLFSP
ncbi:branched-chain amino acid aminotransferase [Trichoderma arundinaceum]|uniref:Branched-chain-amino-acid aminotransferase n=1 Tax=Trichoderma arundinaceum TaxID=490622 RepID=A0A395NI62_TRIAR|nr:branched-chain amino acid aminotransferase [Trichoderma arundinaceum]